MSQYMNLSNAYKTLEKLVPKISISESCYYDILYKISTTILESRIEKNMNQTEFSNLLGVTQAMISKYESGDYNFTIKQICKLCEKLNLSLDFSLYNAKDEKSISYQDDNPNQSLDYDAVGGAA